MKYKLIYNMEYLSIIRVDLVFSYWIFVWYLLYKFRIVKYNPKLALIISLFENIIILVLMIFYLNNIINILIFCVLNFFIKVLPLWDLRKSNSYEIYPIIFLFTIYILATY